MGARKTTEWFISESKKIYGEKYTYNKTIYKTQKDKVVITCPIHGDFEQRPDHFLNGHGCSLCTNENRKLTTETFIEKAIAVHGEKYNYSKVEYIDSRTPVKIICPVHGEFLQIPTNHLFGYGCKKCMYGNKRKNKETFIEQAQKIYGDKYTYEHVKYVKNCIPVEISCPEHGSFFKRPIDFLNGKGCPKCKNESRCLTTEEFIKKSNIIHDNYYLYTKTKYVHSKSPVIITCPKHGDFTQLPNNHLNGQGCPMCGNVISKSEAEIKNFVKNLGFKTVERFKKIKDFEIDIYIPEKNIGIEFDGLYWHSEICKSNAKNYHLNKTKAYAELGIQIIHIFEDEWLEKKEIVKSRICSILGISQTKIYARKCVVKNVDIKTAKKFLTENHIQGYVNFSYSYGLYYNDEIVSLMTFGSMRVNMGRKNVEGEYELLRFCNRQNTNVIGGASRLLKHFCVDIKPTKIISYADRRWSVGNLYEKLGFSFVRNTQPSYFYIKNQKRINRYRLRKDILVKKYGCKPEETEHSFCNKIGLYRIYDCGTKLYEYLCSNIQ